MIHLKLQREPYELRLDGFDDLVLTVRPISTAVVAAARFPAAARLAEAERNIKSVKDMGGEVSGLPDLDDPLDRLAFVEGEYISALGRAAIIAWRGVTLDGATPAPVNAETVSELLSMWPLGERFRDAYLLPQLMLGAEKNASGSAPAGTTAAEPNIAEAAATAASPAPTAGSATMESHASTTPTPPKPLKARRSGN